jgi:hypothetical protein
MNDHIHISVDTAESNVYFTSRLLYDLDDAQEELRQVK